MIRILKTLCTANLALAILILVGYVIYSWIFELPIDQQFLTFNPGGRGSGPKMPAWMIVVFFEIVIVFSFIVGQYAEWDMKSHRLYCAVIGLVGLWSLFPSPLPQSATGALSDSFLQFDYILASYVWVSHLIYAAIGPNDV